MTPRHFMVVFAILIWLNSGSAVGAAEFALGVSPPRLELKARGGDVINQVVRLRNLGTEPQRYTIEAAYWDLTADGDVSLSHRHQAESCQGWLALSQREVNLGVEQTHPYLFSILVPIAQPAGECRFALLIRHPGRPRPNVFPATGQVVVIGYVTVGDAHPALAVENIRLDHAVAPPAIGVDFYNAGTAHGRASGRVVARLHQRKLDLLLPPQAILPGRRRTIWLRPLDPRGHGNLTTLRPPIQLNGRLSWEGGEYTVDKLLMP